MKILDHSFLSLSAPMLILLALVGLLQREGSARTQALPALFVGTGLIISASTGRRNRRKKLLFAIRSKNNLN